MNIGQYLCSYIYYWYFYFLKEKNFFSYTVHIFVYINEKLRFKNQDKFILPRPLVLPFIV